MNNEPEELDEENIPEDMRQMFEDLVFSFFLNYLLEERTKENEDNKC